MIILAFVDPGIMHKILPEYELQEYKEIPISKEAVLGGFAARQRSYSAPVKSHYLTMKFCS